MRPKTERMLMPPRHSFGKQEPHVRQAPHPRSRRLLRRSTEHLKVEHCWAALVSASERCGFGDRWPERHRAQRLLP